MAATSQPGQAAPGISYGQFDSSGIGSIDDSVNLFRGDVNLSLKLLSLPGPHGMDINITASYGSNTSIQPTLSNRTAPTDILGLGWSMPIEAISRMTQQTGTTEDDTFLLFTGGSSIPFALSRDKDGSLTYELMNFQFWKTSYDPGQEKWEIIHEDGIRYIYGLTSIQRAVKWGNWIDSTAASAGASFPIAWNLVEIVDSWGQKISFEYTNDEIPIGNDTNAIYTRACRLRSVKATGNGSIIFNYAKKEFFEIDLPFIPPQTDQPNAFQFQFEENYLQSIEVYNHDGEHVSSILPHYDFFNLAPGDKKNDILYKKRYLTGFDRFITCSDPLPGFLFTYYTDKDDVNPGAIKKIIYPQGGAASFEYSELFPGNTSTIHEILRPGLGFTPKVWNSSAYTIVAWHNRTQGLIQLFVYAWAGSWTSWQTTIPYSHETDYQVYPSGNFAASCYKDSESDSYKIFVYKIDKYKFGTCQEYHFDLGPGYTEKPAVAVGTDFIAVIRNNSPTLNIWQWDERKDEWNKQELESPYSSTGIALYAGNNFCLVAYYDARSQSLSFRLYRSDLLGAWTFGDRYTVPVNVREDLQAGPPEKLVTYNNWFAAATFITGYDARSTFNQVVILQWDPSFRFLPPADNTFAYSEQTDIKIPMGYSVISGSTLINGRNVLRYNGQTFRSGSILQTLNPVATYNITCGDDRAVLSETANGGTIYSTADYDPYTDQWGKVYQHLPDGRPGTLHPFPGLTDQQELDPTSVASVAGVGGNYCILGRDIFYRDAKLRWQKIYTLPLDVDLRTIQNRAPFCFVYEDQDNNDTFILFLEDGSIRGTPELLKDQNIYTESAGEGQSLIGRNSFVTYKGKSFDDPDSLHLYQVVNGSVTSRQADQPVTTLTIDNGYQQFVTRYEYDLTAATFDPSGIVAQYVRVKVIKGTGSGYTEYTWFNGSNPEIPGTDYPPTDGFTNVRDYFSLFGGQPFTVASFDGSGKKVAQTTNYLYAYDSTPDGTPLSGAYTRNRRALQKVYLPATDGSRLEGGMALATETDYNAKGQPSVLRMDNYDSSGKKTTLSDHTTYAWEVYPKLAALNILSPVAAKTKRNDTASLITGITVTTWIDWAAGTAPARWAPHKTYVWDGTPGTETFDYTAWSGNAEPPAGWLRTGIQVAISPNGLPIGSIDEKETFTWTRYDRLNRFAVAQFTRTSLEAPAVSYYGFEEYEDAGTWKLFPGNIAPETLINKGDAFTGTRRLVLPASQTTRTGLSSRIDPIPPGRYILSCYTKTPAGYLPNDGFAGWTVSNDTAVLYTFPITATNGKWANFYCIFDLVAEIEAAPITVTLSVFNEQPVATVLIDNIFFLPFTASASATVVDDRHNLQQASLDHLGRIQRLAYDRYLQPIIELSDEKPKTLVAGCQWRQYATVFDPLYPNSTLQTVTANGGIFENFHHGDEWQNSWQASPGWTLDNLHLVYDTQGPGTIQPKNMPSADSFGLRLRLDADLDPELPLGIRVGAQFTVRWSEGKWQLIDDRTGQILSSASQPKMKTRDLYLLAGKYSLLFYADGKQALKYLSQTPVTGTPVFFTDGPLRLSFICYIDGPRTALLYQDGIGNTIQTQNIYNKDLDVSAAWLDDQARQAVSTKTARFADTLPGYRPQFITSMDWQTGILAGEVADHYPADEGYPYSRDRYDDSPISRLIERGLPGKLLAIDGRIPEKDRHTSLTRASLNAHMPFFEDLPIGCYLVNLITNEDRDPAYKITDQQNNLIGILQGDPAAGDGHFAVTRNDFNEYGRLVRTRLPDSFSTGRPVANSCITFGYDFLGREITRTVPDADAPFLYMYDRIGRIRFMQDANGAAETFIAYWLYDPIGRQIEEGYCNIAWDQEQLKAIVNQPDALPQAGHWNKRFYYDGDGSDPNLIGRLTVIETNNSSSGATADVRESLLYNKSGKTIRKTVTTSLFNGGHSFTSAYEYDNAGNNTRIIYNTGDTQGEFAVINKYDDLGQLILIQYSQGAAAPVSCAAYNYDPGGQLSKETLHPGTANELVRTYAYNSAGLPVTASDRFFSETLDYYANGYEDNAYYSGRIARAAYRFQLPGQSPFNKEFNYRYAYTKTGRLSVAQNSADQQWSFGLTTPFAYDGNGNILRFSKGDQEQTYTYFPDCDRLKQVGAGLYTYNHNGNVLSASERNITAISYNRNSQMTRDMDIQKNHVAEKVFFQYDGNDNRIGKTDAAVERFYARCGTNRPLMEKVRTIATGVIDTTFNIFGPTGLIASKKTGGLYYFIKDYQGSIRAVFDGTNISAAYNYTPFGEFMGAVWEIAGRITQYLFTGQEWDEDLGLYNYNARFYDPRIGRFFSVDPAGQFPSPYIYAGDDAINEIDPTGDVAFLAAALAWFAQAAIAALIGAIVGAIIGGFMAAVTGRMDSFWKAVGIGAASGAAAGATYAIGLAFGGAAMAFFGISSATAGSAATVGGIATVGVSSILAGRVASGVQNAMTGRNFFADFDSPWVIGSIAADALLGLATFGFGSSFKTVAYSDLLQVGSFARQGRPLPLGQNVLVNDFRQVRASGAANGCHTCGTRVRYPSIYHVDHQPPNGIANGGQQYLYPQCPGCSNTQARFVQGQQIRLVPPAFDSFRWNRAWYNYHMFFINKIMSPSSQT